MAWEVSRKMPERGVGNTSETWTLTDDQSSQAIDVSVFDGQSSALVRPDSASVWWPPTPQLPYYDSLPTLRLDISPPPTSEALRQHVVNFVAGMVAPHIASTTS